MSENNNSEAVGLFNYAHSYASSAAELAKLEVDATHRDAPVNFLYFHAIELYLKSFLVSKGHDLEKLRKYYGHKVRPLADLAKEELMELDRRAEEAINLMTETDNVITSRYIRVGLHQRLPIAVYDDLCRSLHIQVEPSAYRNSGISRRPQLWI